MQIKNRGGARPGSGRPKGEPSESITFRVVTKTKNEVLKKHRGKINKMFNEWFTQLSKEKAV